MSFQIDQVIYKFVLKQCIGSGAFGEVWLAHDLSIEHDCALKLIRCANNNISDNLTEARIGNKFNHPNVVNIQYADIITFNDTDDTWVAISMPYYLSGSVSNLLNSQNFLDTKSTLKCLQDILRGLEYLHAMNFFHCDIKPNNILIGEENQFVLSDFGITQYSPGNAPICPRTLYVPHITPETLSYQKYDERSDIYQVGVTAFRLLNGISEIKNKLTNIDAFKANVTNGTLISQNDFQYFVPRSLRKIILKAINRDPDKRYQSALEMRRDLEKVYLKGTYTSTDTGNIILKTENYTYEHIISPGVKDKKNLDTFKESVSSSKRTRVSKYCFKNLTNAQLMKKLTQFTNEMI